MRTSDSAALAPVQTGHLHDRMFCALEEESSLYFTYSGRPNIIQIRDLSYEVNSAAQIHWFEKLSELQMPWEWNSSSDGQIIAIKNLNLVVRSGQMLAIIGSSGCGKTSLLDIITCRDEGGRIKSGKILINGAPVNRQLVKKCIAHVRQDDRLLPFLTVRETLAFVAKLRLPRDFSEEQRNKRIEDVIAELRLRQCANTKVGNYLTRGVSGGERRRVSIGVQLLWNPVDLTSIDWRSKEQEQLTQDKANRFAAIFREKVKDTDDYMWNTSPSTNSTKRDSQIPEEIIHMKSETMDRLAGSFRQFSVLLNRQISNDFRDLPTLSVHGLEALLMSLLIGYLYYNEGGKKLSIQDTVALLYMIGALTPFAVVLDVIAKCHSERAMLYHELEDGMYSVTSYFFAKLLGELPEHCAFVVIYGVPIYWIAALRPEASPFVLNFLLVWLGVYCSRVMALWVSALLPTLQLSFLVGNIFFTIFYLTGGFVISIKNMWTVASLCSKVSFLRWGFQGLIWVQFTEQIYPITFGNLTIPIKGTTIIESMDMDSQPLYMCYIILIAICIGFLALYYVSLRKSTCLQASYLEGSLYLPIFAHFQKVTIQQLYEMGR
ncbi:ATP-binding cassette sub-family G member 8 isoform X4 [Narcine bancroftii]|uniref:ATP-binding cassette sub-family G member 8 isoform X4 n=1 Tax=Narcine bancroftii TaxID=1343680 RepID=UPI0038319386